jgi:MFS family permease
LVTETAYPTHRGVITALYNCGWYVGSLVAAWTTFGTRNYASSWAWRIPSLVQIAIPAASLVGFLLAPESPRWLASKGRIEEARSFLVKHHAGGDESSPLAAFELEEISITISMEKEITKSTSWVDLIRGKSNKHRAFITITLGIFAQWNGVGIASYYLAPVLQSVGITSVTDQTMISGFLQVWNLILAVGAAFSVDRFRRRKLFLTSTAGMLVSYIFITALSATFAKTGVAGTGVAVIPFLFLFYGFYDIAFTPLIVSYTCEIWPYTFRARGNALCQLATQLAIFFNVFVNPIALEAIQWKYYIVYIVMLTIIGATIWFFYPETKGHTLEEMARVFDGDNANVADEKHMREIVRAMSVNHDSRKEDHVTTIENAA